jgi:hypothetical protein
MFHIGLEGYGIGVPAGAMLSAVVTDPRLFRDSSVPFLERIVGNDLRGQPVRAYGISGPLVTETIAAAADAPIGMESLLTNEGTLVYDAGVNLTGLTLRQALDTLVQIDPRYEWREVSGVPVVRPARAWSDPENPLFQPMPSIRLLDVTALAAMNAFVTRFGGPPFASFADTRAFTVDLPAGIPAVGLLAEVSRAHGELSWLWEEVPFSERRDSPTPVRYRILFKLVRGAGIGTNLPDSTTGPPPR